MGEAAVVDPDLLDALRFADLSDVELPAYGHRFLIAAARFPGEPRLVATAARLGRLLCARHEPTVDRDLRRSLDFLARSSARAALDKLQAQIEVRTDLPRSREFFAGRRGR